MMMNSVPLIPNMHTILSRGAPQLQPRSAHAGTSDYAYPTRII